MTRAPGRTTRQRSWWVAAGARPATPAARALLFGAWLVAALFLASRHVMWRDEVRAWVLALGGGDVIAMLRAVHGEGHPALWYLLVRTAHALLTEPYALPMLAFMIGAAAAGLLAWRAPFGWGTIAVILFARFTLYEYTVMARNYGISALILYAIAALYPRWRDRGWILGPLLAMLCNTNAPSVILAGAFLLFWAVDIAGETHPGWSPPWRAWLIGVACVGVGALLCVLTVYPTFNDAAPVPAARTIRVFLGQFAAHGFHFGALLPETPFELRKHTQVVIAPLMLVFASLWWWRNPGALIALFAALLGLIALFAFVYDGDYRHQALFLAFMVAIAWLVAEGHGGRWPGGIGTARWPRAAGGVGLILVCGFQFAETTNYLRAAARGVPQSRVREVASLLRRPDLRNAILIGDPDYILESFSYYAPNPLYFVRDHRFGRFVLLSKRAFRTVRAIELLDEAQRLRAATGRPVVILMNQGIFRQNEPGREARGSYGDLIVAPNDLDRFRAAASEAIALPVAYGSDESYDVFILATSPSRAAPERPSAARGALAKSAGLASPQAASR